MIRNIYKKYIKDKFFNKILLSYTGVIILVLSILSFFIYQSILFSQQNKAISYNLQVVQNVKAFMDLKDTRAKQVLQQLYLGQNSFMNDEDIRTIFDLLENDIDYLTTDYLTKNQSMHKYLKSACSFDFDITGVYLLKIKDNKVFYNNVNPSDSARLTIDNVELNKFLDKKYLGTKLILVKNIFTIDPQSNSNDIFTFATNISSTAFNKRIGILLINFTKNNIKTAYSSIDKNFSSDVLVLTKAGDIIFDSSGKNDNSIYPDFETIKNSISESPVTLINKNNITNVIATKDSGLIVISTVSNSQIYKNVSGSRNTILFILVLSILGALLLSYIIISVFSKRIKVINIAMKQVESGNLSSRIKVYNNKDEISQIASNFNNMCDNLNDYINKAYIYDLKRKDAELKQRASDLYALQSQINPHFLYNTLETIRMRALTSENEDISKMIRSLAELFRSSIKKKIIVKISDEINYCKNYLEIYKIRYGPDLEADYEIDEDILEYGVPKHLIQPLIENSIVHGINTKRGNNHISIKGWKSGTDAIISITDNGNGINEEGLLEIKKMLESSDAIESESIGIVNVDQRIKLIFGKAYGIQVSSEKDKGTTIEVRIAAMSVKELEENVQGHVG